MKVRFGFLCDSAGKESACNAGDLGSIPGLGRTPGEGKGHPFQYSGLENSRDCIVHEVAKSRTRLSDFYFVGLCCCVCSFSSCHSLVVVCWLLTVVTSLVAEHGL